jgi:hypothetical protein
MSVNSTQISGLGYDTLPSLSTSVLAVQYSWSWYLGGSCMPALRNLTKGLQKKFDKRTYVRRNLGKMCKWTTPRMGPQVSSLGTLKGAAQRI